MLETMDPTDVGVTKTKKTTRPQIIPMKVHVISTSHAAETYRRRPGIPLSRMAIAARRGTVAAKPTKARPASGIPPTPKSDLIFHGGKTIPNLDYRNFYLGGTGRWKASDVTNVDGALSAAMTDKNLNNVMVQYLPGGKIGARFRGSRKLTDPLPTIVETDFIAELIRTQFDKGTFDKDDLTRTIYNFLLPSGVFLRLGGGPDEVAPAARRRPGEHDGPEIEKKDDSLNGLGGFHGSVHIPTGNGGSVTLYYSVGVYSEKLSQGKENGIVCFAQPWKNIVCTFYHELQEFRTDPDIDDVIATNNLKLWGWASHDGEECGDGPMNEVGPELQLIMQEVSLAKGTGKVPVQFQYSNYVHGPEGPTPTPRPLSKKIAKAAKA